MTTIWLIVIAKPNYDATALRGLRDAGYRPYSPKYFKKGERPRLRMPGYILVPVVAERKEWGPIKKTSGVARIVTDPDSFEPIPLRKGNEVVAMLREWEDEEFFGASDMSKKRARTDLAINERVRIVSGKDQTLIGREGALVRLQRGKAWVFAGIGMWEVDEVDLESIEPKDEAKPAKAKKGKRRR